MHDWSAVTAGFAAAIALAACASGAGAQEQSVLVVDPPALGSFWIEQAGGPALPALPVKLVRGRRAACVNAAFLIGEDGRVGRFRILASAIRGTPLAGEKKQVHQVAVAWLAARRFTAAPGNPQRNPVFTRSPTIVFVPDDRHYDRQQEQALAAECDVGLLGGHLQGRYESPASPEAPFVVGYATRPGRTITVP